MAFDMEALLLRLKESADRGYAEFNSGLVPGVKAATIGVRVPILRKIGRDILRGDDWRDFLEASRAHSIFEFKMLHAYVLGGARCPIDEKLALIEQFLPHIDNWAVCDGLCSTLKPKRGEADALFEYCVRCAESEAEFRKRFGLVMLMSRYHDQPYIDGTMAAYRAFHHDGYYARMGAAWGLATLWLYAREAVLAILKENLWDDFTHNKAIQKLRESYRVSDGDKALAQSLRRKTKRQDS